MRMRLEGVLITVHSVATGGLRRLAITVDKCCHWLQQLPHEYSNMRC